MTQPAGVIKESRVDEALLAEFTRLQREVRRLGDQLDVVQRDVWRFVNDLTRERYESYR